MRDDDSEIIDELLMQWDERRDSGVEPSAAELCKDHPHLLSRVKERIQEIKSLDRFEIEESPVEVEQGFHDLDSTIPARIGGYNVISEIGRGAMGIVYRCKHPLHQADIALKVLRPDFSLDSKEAARLKREAEILSTLDHPSIAKILDCGTTAAKGNVREHSFVALEFVEGKSLRKYAKKKTTREVVELLIQIVEAISHAHQRGVVHRDIKPTNVVVTESGVPELLDFGVGKFLGKDPNDALTSHDSKTLLGTLAYMSPEQIDHPELPDVRSDIYSVSALAYELLTGKMPFVAPNNSPAQLLKAIEKGHPKSLGSHRSELAGDLSDIVLKGLNKAPEDRYQSAAQLAEDLRRYINGEPIVGVKAPLLTQIRRWAKENRTLAAVSLGSALLIMATTSFAVYSAFLANQNATAANRHAATATAATSLAEKRSKELERANYNLNLAAATDNLPFDPFAVVDLLEDETSCPKELRDFAWRLLYQRSKSAVRAEHEFKTQATAVCFSPEDDSLLFVGFLDGRVIGLEVSGWEIRFDEQVSDEAISRLAFDGENTLAVGNNAGELSVLDVASGKRLSAAQFSPCKSIAYSSKAAGFVALCRDGELLSAVAPAFAFELQHNHVITVKHAAYSERSRTFFVCEDSNDLAFIDIGGSKPRTVANRTRKRVDSVAFIATGEAIEFSNLASTLWNPLTGEMEREYVSFPHPILRMNGNESGVEAAVGRRLRIRWPNRFENRFRDLVQPSGMLNANDVAVSSNGGFVAATPKKSAFAVWNLKPLAPTRSYVIPATRLIAIDERGEHILLGTQKGIVLVDDMGERSQQIELAKPARMAINHKRSHAAISGQKKIYIVDLQNLAVEKKFACPHGPATLCFGPNDKKLICDGRDGDLFVYDIETGKSEAETLHDRYIRHLVLVPGTTEVISADRNGSLARYDWSAKKVVWRRKNNGRVRGVRDLILSPNGREFFTCEQGGRIIRWNIETGEQVAQLVDSNSPINGITISPDGKTLASINGSGFIDFWDPITGLHRLRLEGHSSEGMAIEFSRDGYSLISAGRDSNVHTWRLSTSN